MVTDLVAEGKVLSFAGMLARRAADRRSWLCVGLDPVLTSLPSSLPRSVDGLVEFCASVVTATFESAAAFKINFGFFEALGPAGWEAIRRVREAVPAGVPVIADAKRGDIPTTARAYARAIFDELGFDAATVSPYLGPDSLAPFLDYPGKGVFVLCRTSNETAGAVQDVTVDGGPLYLHVARLALALPCRADLGLVVGANQPQALGATRALSEDVIILMPGVGAQGAGVGEAMAAGANRRGANGLPNVSRHVIYASSGTDFEEAAATAARRYAAESWQVSAREAAD